MTGHLKHLLLGGFAVVVLIIATGVDVWGALPWVLLLVCPLMMAAMVAVMGRGGGHDHGKHPG